ncbi:hypothetical protein GCM10011519_14670 [Marmoricola endophyticus]|uniref:WD40 repeat domain-containing protein n=1 Tax=Marmoricola endophyticus TaxID=2040280 RepID=A0A917BGX5_9ACTN|nr:hypothetical protein [Marmoricola endophyticus]GGF41908.1 hypothetical protein GCM10011519_14670 [Marmoricola endophyticus]
MNPIGPVAAVVALLLPAVGLPAATGSTRCVVGDPRIDEASGLVDGLGPDRSLMVTANDSGDAARVFVLDEQCRTVGVRTYGGEGTATDVEALAPDGPGHVWVGDTGDNTSSRDEIVVRRVAVGRGDRTERATSYRLVYPDGAHDAETLLRDPRSGRLYVVTKQLLSSQVYAAPRTLDAQRPNRLAPVARVSLTPTDGAFLADGSRVVLRGYGTASVYAVPGWRLLGAVELPKQPQGESLSVGPGDRVRVGSEGVRQPILEVRLPGRLTGSPTARRGDVPTAADGQDRHVSEQNGWTLPALGSGLVVVAGLGWVLRRRGR